MRRSRFATSLVALATASLVLTACGRDEGGGGAVSQSDEISGGEATGTIDVWAMEAEGEALQDFVSTFEEANPDADVKVTAIPWASAHNKISTAIASGNTPDVSLIGTTWMGEFAEAGGLMPTPEGLVDEADFFEGAWGSTEVGGTSYGVPWYVETRVLYYRKDLAAKAGWDNPPQSWDELKQFATDLQDKAGVEHGLNLQPGQTGSWQSVMPFAWSNGASITDESGEQYTLDSPEMAEALDYYASYFKEGISSDHLMDPGELESGFADGTFGSFISGPWHAQLVEDAGVKPDQYAVAPLPGTDSAPGTSFVGGGDLAVFKDSDNTDAAWKLVQWLSQPETQQDFYDTVGDLPAVSSAWDSGKLASDPQLQVFGTQLKDTVAPPAVPTWEQVAASFDSLVEQVAKGSLDSDEAVKEMQSKAQSIGTGL